MIIFDSVPYSGISGITPEAAKLLKIFWTPAFKADVAFKTCSGTNKFFRLNLNVILPLYYLRDYTRCILVHQCRLI